MLSEKKDANGNTLLRVYQNYDSAGQLVGQIWRAGSANYSEGYTYNVADGSLSTMTTGTGETLQFSYDDLQRLTSVGNGLYTRNYSYRNLSDTRTTAQVSQVQYAIGSANLNYGYTYDALGNVATYSAPGKGTVTYTYDALGQLLNAVGDESYTYTYDDVGNILTANGHTYSYSDMYCLDLLIGYDGQTITYDYSGNPLSYYNGTRWTFTWENGRSLATATDGTTNISYAYDANGLRTAKTVGNVTHNYLYAGGQLLRETYGDNTLDFFYDAGGCPYALKYNGTTYYYITNLQGDVMYLVDAQGNTVASYDYDPYGNIVSGTGTMADVNPLRYRGYYYDAELEMYYLQSRYYDPQIGRFINADVYASTGQGVVGFNMFAYCNNNPENGVDPSGDCQKYLFYKKDCGRTTCKSSKNYIRPRVAVIYDGRTSGYMYGRFGGEGFAHQGKELVKRLSKSCAVTSYSYQTIDGFVDCWNSLSGTYDAIYILGHGQPGKLNGKGGSLMPSGGKYSYSDLQKVKATDLFLYICNGASPNASGVSTAKCFARLTRATVHAVAYGKMNFSWNNCVPKLASGVWVKIRV